MSENGRRCERHGGIESSCEYWSPWERLCFAEDDELAPECRERLGLDEDEDDEVEERDCYDCEYKDQDGDCVYDGPCPGVETE